MDEDGYRIHHALKFTMFNECKAPVSDHISFMEILHADDTLLITKNTRTMNRLLHAVEEESQYYG